MHSYNWIFLTKQSLSVGWPYILFFVLAGISKWPFTRHHSQLKPENVLCILVTWKNANFWKRITCSVYRYVCVSLQIDIASYWPGMHNTAFLVVERNRFDLFKNVSIFSTLLLCKLPKMSRFWHCYVIDVLFTVLILYMYLIALFSVNPSFSHFTTGRLYILVKLLFSHYLQQVWKQ